MRLYDFGIVLVLAIVAAGAAAFVISQMAH